MLSWGAKRRLFYLSLIVGFLFVVIGIPLYSSLGEPASCTDAKQNQREEGVDCGGPCEAVCRLQVADLVVLWSRVLKGSEGSYDAVAFVENPNPKAGIRGIAYSFELFDAENILVAERRGTTFVNPNTRFAIYESAIETGKRVPTRTLFSFEGTPEWVRTEKEGPTLIVKNRVLDETPPSPKLRAVLENDSLIDARDITVVALLFDERDNLVGVGKTAVGDLLRESERDITFVWSEPFSSKPVRIDILPRIDATRF
ncbi:MAG: hypothetical protein HY457_01375 [Parcubacteria group bacterium]|nr:hypothetical protein [Parcubacteria group bacterium]